MDIEHEVDERALQHRPLPAQDGKPGTGELRAGFKIEDSERLADFQM